MSQKEFDPYDLDAIEHAQRLEDGEIDGNDNPNDATGGQGDGGNEDANLGAEDANANANTNANAGTGGEGGDGSQQVDQGKGAESGSEGAKPVKPVGVQSKDGSRVLPYTALTEARSRAQKAAQERDALKAKAEQLEAEIERLKSGQPASKAAGDDAELTDAEIAEIEADYPLLAKAARAARAAAQRVSQQPAKEPAAQRERVGEQEDQSGDPVQDAIDANPDLLTWQTDPAHASKFQRAVEVDNFLKTSPKWQGKSLEERFAEATRRVREEFDIEEPPQASASQQQATTATKQQVSQQRQQQAREVINRTQRRGPTTLSDVKGGAAPAADSVSALNPVSMLNKFESMSTEEILAQLDRGG